MKPLQYRMQEKKPLTKQRAISYLKAVITDCENQQDSIGEIGEPSDWVNDSSAWYDTEVILTEVLDFLTEHLK